MVRRSAAAASELIDVVVPVYRGLEATRRCIDSVLAAACRTPHELLVIDDGSPEPALAQWLREAAAMGRFTLLENASNLGFVATANRGMRLHPDRDVVLLNSDAEVANDWLDRLAACARSGPDIGTVTPFSNNATICSYPFEGWGGGVPGGLGLAGLDRLLARTNAGRSVDLPTAVGFCMYVRRDCLDEIGLFDEVRFGRGYGEENDFCMRAARAGWRNVLAADVYVFHEGGASFGDEQQALRKAAMAALLEKHPQYLDGVHEFIRRDPVQPLRLAIDRARAQAGAAEEEAVVAERALRRQRAGAANAAPARPARLHITHSWGGGVGRWVSDFRDGDGTHRNLALQSCTDRNHAAYRIELVDLADPRPPLRIWKLAAPIEATAIAHREYRSILGEAIAANDVRDLVVSSLIGHAFDALDTGLPTVVALHDLHPFCPALFACFGAPCTDCPGERLQRCLQSNPYNVFWHSSTAAHWLALRDEYPRRLAQPWVTVAAPTQGIRDRWTMLLPAMAALPWHRIPHGEDIAGAALTETLRPAPTRSTKLRVVVPGRLAPHKGLHLLREALAGLLPIADLLLLGSGDFGEVFAGTDGVRIVPEYAHADLADEIRRFAPDCALLLSVLPESYSYTLSEMFALGVPVVATRLGAFAERIDDGATGLLIEPDAGALLACLRRIAAEPQVLAAIRANLARRPCRDVAAMVRDYDALLAGLRVAAVPARLSAEPAAVAGAALPAASPADDRERIRREVRGTFYLPDVLKVFHAVVPPGDRGAAARLVEVAAACTAARNDVCFFVHGAGADLSDWGTRREEAIVMLSTRRLFLAEGSIYGDVSLDRMRIAADAYVSLAAVAGAKAEEGAALRAGQLLLSFDPDLPWRRARCAGQIVLLSAADAAAGAAMLSYWFDLGAQERARIVERTRRELEQTAHGGGADTSAVVAVVVTYQPRLETLSELLAAMAPQVDRIVVVDDGSSPPLRGWIRAHAPAGVDPLFLGDNRGLAAAQNAGIARARELGAGFVLLSDQDSVPEPDMVERLLAALHGMRGEGTQVAAVGPWYRDPRGAPGTFVRLRGLRYEHRACSGGSEVIEADQLIASGCLIPMSVLDAVGTMSEPLFIDYVDTEWALRARAAGYRFFGICAARMRHDRGRTPLVVFGRTIPMHDPLRHYYQNRNAVWLCRRRWLPLRWKLANGLRIVRNLLVYSLLPGPRLQRLRMSLLGIRHGLHGRMGRYG